ncbi:hypothetical protein CSKR_107873 [Clonorchis sinensis]|uniref:Uncharacterized protein n=1 Tax=Clonorchis sinensis TaxID=79923 RepID=A0A3R7FGB6_CLOSI|nr:hypothetical protein CSKR_107873 [Clonorchis sinensis]
MPYADCQIFGLSTPTAFRRSCLRTLLGVDQPDNAPSIFSVSQPSVKPRQRESALLKVRQRPRSMQRVAAYTKTRPRASALDQVRQCPTND